MAFRFQKRVKIAPGVSLNFSKSGVSTSLGPRGAKVNLSSKGVRTTVGIPGTGLSWSEQNGWSGASKLKPANELLQLGNMLDKLARDFNGLSPKTNKVSATWNKAVESFDGGRGPSKSKFETLTKRFHVALEKYQEIENDVRDKQNAVNAIGERLNAISFGMFAGNLKAARKEFLALVDEHERGSVKLLDAVTSVSQEVIEEYNAAKSRLS